MGRMRQDLQGSKVAGLCALWRPRGELRERDSCCRHLRRKRRAPRSFEARDPGFVIWVAWGSMNHRTLARDDVILSKSELGEYDIIPREIAVIHRTPCYPNHKTR